MSPSVLKVFIDGRGGQERVSKAIGCTIPELSQVINGHRENKKLRERLAAYFNMTIEEMFDGEFDAVVNYRRTA